MTIGAIENAGSAAPTAAANRNSLRYLALGAIVGIGLGCLSLTGWIGADPLPGAAVARVNGAEIRLAEYERALALFASEKRDAITEHDRALILERMVEEELLVQHGIAAGLLRGDPGVRTTVLRAMLTGLTAEFEAEARESGGENTEAAVDTHDSLLRDYLDQLRDEAAIRWVDGGSEP